MHTLIIIDLIAFVVSKGETAPAIGFPKERNMFTKIGQVAVSTKALVCVADVLSRMLLVMAVLAVACTGGYLHVGGDIGKV